jgi:stage III sporulation protein AG
MGRFNNLLKDIKQRITKYGSKKLIEKAVIIAIVGVICLIAGSVLFDGSNQKGGTGALIDNASNTESVTAIKQENSEEKNEIENKLKTILSKINGAGKVDVMVTFYSGNESVPAIDSKSSENDTQEKDKEGGTRAIKQSDVDNKVIYEENNGVKKPFVVKELLPAVKGVVIVADGANDIEIKSNLAMATEALLDVPSHKIQVFKRSAN